MFNVYIKEAHPEDGWYLPGCPLIKQTKSLEDRLNAATGFVNAMQKVDERLAKIPMIIDDPVTNSLDCSYEALPERLVVLDQDLKVVFLSGAGPFQYSTLKLESMLNTLQ
eukprot:gnl/MRDRNA2_/MRDRNA2_143279_c0_seq1.p1 gnl/MRDRNA2_/MRDRNA2_143279_c0~~gnl/MRDRNA2_/MRDRNA2_143279_c0_seq1.p1  ORF type:complete len:110 (-),score=16.99 gnl/MRDRNA2_/MRDRNA2_143279_c0_seq1:148-477(-)